MIRLLHKLAALTGVFVGSAIAASLAFGGFSSGSTAAHSVQTKRIFSGSRVAGVRQLTDASSGTATANPDVLSFAEGTVKTTGAWATSFNAARYFQFNFASPLPAGVPVSGATFDFRMLPNTSTDTVCYYFEVHRQSDNSLLATHYSSSSPQCVTGTTWTTNSVALPEVTTSDIANDLYVKVFGRDSTAARAWKIDMGTITLTEYSTSETLYQKAYIDASTGTATTTTWSLDAADSSTYTNLSNWATSFSATRYLQFTFPAYVPSGAVVTGATFIHSYKNVTAGDNICHYFEVYSSTTLLAAHGSTGTPVSCNATTSFVTDTVSIPEVNTVARANSVVIKDYVRDATAARKSLDDRDTLTVTYYLD